MESARVVIYVDVDGVLNVSAKTASQAPTVLDDGKLLIAAEYDNRPLLNEATKCPVDRLAALVCEEQYDLCKSACPGVAQLSPVLTKRLAGLIACAGPDRIVVLASDWRRGRHAGRVAELEGELSRHLGYAFSFDMQTDKYCRLETTAADRMRCVGNHMRSLFADGRACDRRLKVLVLEDFFMTPLDGWRCEDIEVRTTEDAEGYLRRCAPEAADVTVRLIHTYDELRTQSGLRLHVGTGLTLERYGEADSFLRDDLEAEHTMSTLVSSSEEFGGSTTKPYRSRKFANDIVAFLAHRISVMRATQPSSLAGEPDDWLDDDVISI